VVHPLLPKAVSLHQSGELDVAANLYEQIIAQIPRHFDATHLLGVVALQQGRLDEAEQLIGSALQVKPNDPAALNNRGTIRLRTGNLEGARSDFDRVLKVKPNDPDALVNLGRVLHQLGRPKNALVPLRRAFAGKLRSSLLCDTLGACLVDTGAESEAVGMFEIVTELEPNNSVAWSNLSVALNRSGDRLRAGQCAEKAVMLDPGSSNALAAVAAVELANGHIDAAISSYRKAIALPAPAAGTYVALANALLARGRFDEGLEQLRIAVQIDPSNALARWKLAISQCKPIYRDACEIDASRQTFEQRLGELRSWFDVTQPAAGYTVVGSDQPFYLAYQPADNKQLLTQYGDLCAQWMKAVSTSLTMPKRQKSSKPLTSEHRLRIGIVSAHISNHSVWNAITKGWLDQLDKDRFEIHVFHLGTLNDTETEFARRQSVRYHDKKGQLSAWIKCITESSLDALIYPEISMDHLTTQLATLRLSPVQAVCWGHPQTSGLATMDLFLSGDSLEPTDAQDHYRERLVRLDNVGVYVEPLAPSIEMPNLRSLGLPDNEPLLLCPGTPYKYSPVHDRVWVQIAKGMSAKRAGRLVFFRSGSEHMDLMLQVRLREAFAKEGADFKGRVCIIERLSRAEYYGLMQQSTLLLDTLGFSGFNTAIQSIECGLPILAFEGDYMRGRLASGMIRRLNLEELVAEDSESFVRMALELAFDASALARLRLEIINRRNLLFRDPAPIRSLERCLADNIVGSRAA
jgi:predicted O-linked N-acetylglucosamine transferase (SPINDLY family)